MERLHAPNEFFPIRKPRERIRAREQPWRPRAGRPHRPANRQGDDG